MTDNTMTDNVQYLARSLTDLTDGHIEEVLAELEWTIEDLQPGPVRVVISHFGLLVWLELNSRMVAMNHARAAMADGHLISTTWNPHADWGECWQGECWCDYLGSERPTEAEAEQDAVAHLSAVGVPDMRDGGVR